MHNANRTYMGNVGVVQIFIEGGEGFVRLAYATSEDNIREGLRRMKEFVESL